MLTAAEYVNQSINTNLFFLRIVKEHLIFAAAALTLRDARYVPVLMQAKNQFEELLNRTVSMANGIVTPQTLAAGDILTPYTYRAEVATQNYTGLPINTEITGREAELANSSTTSNEAALEQQVNSLNQNIMSLLNSTIQTQTMMLNNVLSCRMFVNVYPLMMDHVTREAQHYLEHLQILQRRQSLKWEPKTAAEGEAFWNRIMAEHSSFIRGMLDPTESDLIGTANNFMGQFNDLTRAAREALDNLQLVPQITRSSLTATTNLRNFKQQGTLGILECKIRSIILPLLSDHVLREANHYLKELGEFKV